MASAIMTRIWNNFRPLSSLGYKNRRPMFPLSSGWSYSLNLHNYITSALIAAKFSSSLFNMVHIIPSVASPFRVILAAAAIAHVVALPLCDVGLSRCANALSEPQTQLVSLSICLMINDLYHDIRSTSRVAPGPNEYDPQDGLFIRWVNV